MNTYLWRITQAPRFIKAIATRAPQLAAMEQDAAAQVRAFAQAVSAVLQDDLSGEERACVQAIEALRERLTEATGETVPNAFTGRNDSIPALARTSSRSAFWGALLFKLIRALAPASCLELGTCLGISTAYQAAALALNGSGRLASIEGDPARAEMAKANLDGLNLVNVQVVSGLFAETLDPVLRDYAPIHFAYIDGDHTEQGTMRNFEHIRPHLAPNAVVIFDDITWSPGMHRAWMQIREAPGVYASVDLFTMGAIFADPIPVEKRHYALGFARW